MTPESPDPTRTDGSAPLLAEDLLLVLVDPRSGAIASEGTLFYLLGGAVLTELALDGHVTTEERDALRGPLVTAAPDVPPPGDPLLVQILAEHLAKPSGAQTFVAAAGPVLRRTLLDRLVARGDVEREQRRVLGLIPSTTLVVQSPGRRDDLVSQIRAALVDGATPNVRTTALIALLSGSGTLVSLHREVPWTSPVIARAAELARGDLGAQAAGEAVSRTTNAIITAVTVAATLPGR
ncbi:GPP34 family phosphoprotein [Pseudoclavibacter chungangensis]|uniref:GPP34 family phosphoprotein n=1 Tax=Pseudoclavibacter chungangensis TaxID=587635 RepID=A0A7J5BQW2_9MICO|nr:GPP34 family phosphoprotein [Pseudoclavibacter chungangensis]KAB1656691.1 GPP34 family phosphoprotein [Pseudoclavibacter chungangensis]NYJ67855.1 hypothetical protein [Pseudoclavibacter chungangensis]